MKYGMRIVAINDLSIMKQAIKVLKKGGLVVVPSDTVYGLSVDATNTDAVRKLISFKSRAPGKAISVFVGSLENAQKYVEITPHQEQVFSRMLPGSFTLFCLPNMQLLVILKQKTVHWVFVFLIFPLSTSSLRYMESQ